MGPILKTLVNVVDLSALSTKRARKGKVKGTENTCVPYFVMKESFAQNTEKKKDKCLPNKNNKYHLCERKELIYLRYSNWP